MSILGINRIFCDNFVKRKIKDEEVQLKVKYTIVTFVCFRENAKDKMHVQKVSLSVQQDRMSIRPFHKSWLKGAFILSTL